MMNWPDRPKRNLLPPIPPDPIPEAEEHLIATFDNVLVAYYGHPRVIFNFTVKVYWFKDLTNHIWVHRTQADMVSCNGLAHIKEGTNEEVVRKAVLEAEEKVRKEIISIFPDRHGSNWEGGI